MKMSKILPEKLLRRIIESMELINKLRWSMSFNLSTWECPISISQQIHAMVNREGAAGLKN